MGGRAKGFSGIKLANRLTYPIHRTFRASLYHHSLKNKCNERDPLLLTLKKQKGGTQIRTGGKGFAILCLTTWPCRHLGANSLVGIVSAV